MTSALSFCGRSKARRRFLTNFVREVSFTTMSRTWRILVCLGVPLGLVLAWAQPAFA